ncbi:MAG: hypothetical protein LBC10_00810 [Deltaproteobacteria bacterium]|jgi:hypothetical protein|nr:hypothetical protein [Deltaproteobacteria bacterium]
MTNRDGKCGKVHKTGLFDTQWRAISRNFFNEHQALVALQSAIRKYFGIDAWHTDDGRDWFYATMRESLYKVCVTSEIVNGRIEVTMKEIVEVPAGTKPPHHIEPIQIDLPG